MEIVTQPADWERLCELVNATRHRRGYDYSCRDVLDGIQIMQRAQSPFASDAPNQLHAGQDLVKTNISEYYDLCFDLFEQIRSGYSTTRPEFYLTLAPTEISPRRNVHLRQEMRERISRLSRKSAISRKRGGEAMFRYFDYVDLSTLKGWEDALITYYTLSRLLGMRDTQRYME